MKQSHASKLQRQTKKNRLIGIAMMWCHSRRSIELLALLLVICSTCQVLFLAIFSPSLPLEPLPLFGRRGNSKRHYHHHDSTTPTLENPQDWKNQLRNVTIENSPIANANKKISTVLPKAQEEGKSAVEGTHKIPKILLFTHYKNLLEESPEHLNDEERVLAANIRHSINTNNPHTTIFLTDQDCIDSLNRVFPSLVQYFEKETEGMFKADICRGSALYEHGGIYLDVDIGVRTNLWLDLLPTTEFVTAKVHQQSNYLNHFFQAILGAAPQSPILYKYLQLFYKHYTGKEVVKKGPLGVILLRRAWDRTFNATTRSPATELYSEVIYDSKVFQNIHPAPTWGTRRACHFLVVANANNVNHTELTFKGHNFHVPLYSRIGGSRMCPLHNNHTTTTTRNGK